MEIKQGQSYPCLELVFYTKAGHPAQEDQGSHCCSNLWGLWIGLLESSLFFIPESLALKYTFSSWFVSLFPSVLPLTKHTSVEVARSTGGQEAITVITGAAMHQASVWQWTWKDNSHLSVVHFSLTCSTPKLGCGLKQLLCFSLN